MNFVATSLRLSAGVIVWALHFSVIYGLTALACARGAPQAVPWVIGIATVVASGACVAIIARELGRGAGFEPWLTAGLTVLALLAILWETLPVLMVPPCV
ncbi:hypothetical protein [Aromatoleum aromaticum]|uniref:Predicted membrane protein, putative accessory subunit of cytochrome c oxidase n=1 Tax=Aromatoleum aromaticum (strain DSM 19018 / LMG 30748 / EbN1) TaxID=76114 RepID=Q5P1W6_AROAE|nr:hypothetical protein [Aromatoleum aromaticum]NMG56106.1 hypothetical protein [Aromatoleum aromaticum]CAI08698.1 predicted membrane protein, putative accessory subunit of cytochrome c oxidase [Aromatoleum aromaticum EbN1]